MKADLVERFEDGNRIIDRLNRSHPIHYELRRIIEKTCGLRARIRQALEPLSQRIDWAAIFGSVSRGTSHAASDVDRLLIGVLTQSELIERIQPLEAKLNREIAFRLYTRNEFDNRRQSDPFLTRVLYRLLMPIVGTIDSVGNEENQGARLH
jgi:predicted nucleotidyltransferase